MVFLFKLKSSSAPAVGRRSPTAPALERESLSAAAVERKSPGAAAVEQTSSGAFQAPPQTIRTAPEPFQAPPEAVQTAPDEVQMILDQLRAAGSDLSRPHPMEFYLFFPTEELAHRVAERIADNGFRVEVKKTPQGRPAWMCYVTKSMVPRHAEIAAIGKRFSAIAQEFGGEYDGWETEVVK